MGAVEAVKVLIVDDSADVMDLLKFLLTERGYSVRTSTSAHEAIAIVERDRPHCVILDVLMPGMDGAVFAKRLRDTYNDDIVLIACPAIQRRIGSWRRRL